MMHISDCAIFAFELQQQTSRTLPMASKPKVQQMVPFHLLMKAGDELFGVKKKAKPASPADAVVNPKRARKIASKAPDLSMWENDVTTVPMTSERKARIRRAAEKTLLDLKVSPKKLQKPTLQKEKWQEAAVKAAKTGRMANTLAKALANRYAKRWQFVDFLGPKGRESAGIVDIVAIRKSGLTPESPVLKKLDLFEIILIQVKGGSAPNPTAQDMARLRAVQATYNAREIVLFQWKKGVSSGFFFLNEESIWEQATAAHLFR